MRLLIADKLHPRAVEELRTLPLEVVYEPELTKDTLTKRLPGFGILVVRSTEVTEQAIEGARSLNLIVRAGAEYSTIDVRAASRRGIFVANCPGRNAAAVAELVMGLLVAVDRRVPDALIALREGRFERAEFSKAEGLHGKTMGIAGLGHVGREVAHRARAFGMPVVAWSRGLTAARASELGIGHAPTLEELAARSDVLTVHLTMSSERMRGIVSKQVFARLPPRAIFVNTARAALVDHEAMLAAVRERGLRVALDVYPDEPRGTTSYANELFAPATATAGFVYGTPHIAASTDQAQLAIAMETVRVIRAFLVQGNVPNCINVVHGSLARFQLVLRMVDKVGSLANVLSVLKRHGINIEEVRNDVFEGGGAACAKLRLVSRPSEACLSEIRAFDEVLHVDLVTLPNLA
jgi:D-3-phosphoglycerate dehydrogenase